MAPTRQGVSVYHKSDLICPIRTVISQTPTVMGGKPCVRGMRVTAGMIMGLVASGQSLSGIPAAYPYLEEEDIRRSSYAAWRVEEIEVPLPAA